MAELDDARTLVPLAAADLAPEDLVSVFHSASNTTRKVPAVDFYNIAEGTPVHATAATATFTGTTIPASRVVQVASNAFSSGLYIFDTALTGRIAPPWGVLVGATDSDSIDNLIAAINGSAGAGTLYDTLTPSHPLVTASAGAGDTMVVTADAKGAAANAFTVLTSGPGVCAWGAATLTGGIDATEAMKGEKLFDEDFLYIAVDDVTVSSSSGWKTSTLTAL